MKLYYKTEQGKLAKINLELPIQGLYNQPALIHALRALGLSVDFTKPVLGVV